jgi:type I restriction enzyme S subunit
MKEGWEIKKLGDVCNLYQPKTISGEMLVEYGKYLVYGANGIIGRYNEYNHENSEVLLTCRGATCGTINISKPYSWVNGNAMVVQPKNNNIGKVYLQYLLKAVDWSKVITGAAQPQITRQSLSILDIPVPPLSEQEKIVAELDCLSGIIEKKKQQLKELDSLAQSIFYEMFGDPVENDKNLIIKKLGDVALSVNYGTSSPAEEGGRYIYLRMNNLTYNGYLDFNDIKYIDVSDKDIEKYVVRKGDILFNRTNSKELVGKTALFDFDTEMVIAGYIIRVRVDKEKVLPVYVVRYMNTPFMKKYFSNLCKGAVNQANINSKELKSIPILIPLLSLQQQFAERIELIEKQKELIKQSIKETETLFDSRMEYYFNS